MVSTRSTRPSRGCVWTCRPPSSLAQSYFDTPVVSQDPRSRLGTCLCSDGTRDAVSRAAALPGPFSRDDKNNNRTFCAAARSPLAPPLRACTDHGRRSTGSIPPGGNERPDLHGRGIDTPSPTVHRASRLHRARVRRPITHRSTAWDGTIRIRLNARLRGRPRRLRRRRLRDASALGVQSRDVQPHRRRRERSPRRHHRDAPTNPAADHDGRGAGAEAGAGPQQAWRQRCRESGPRHPLRCLHRLAPLRQRLSAGVAAVSRALRVRWALRVPPRQPQRRRCTQHVDSLELQLSRVWSLATSRSARCFSRTRRS